MAKKKQATVYHQMDDARQRHPPLRQPEKNELVQHN
jgi:hypothetical protein